MTRLERDRMLAVLIGVTDQCGDYECDDHVGEELDKLSWEEAVEMARTWYVQNIARLN